MSGVTTLYPYIKEIPADIETPVSAYYALRENGRKGFLLESVETGEKLGRYSFLGFEPEMEFIARKKEVTIIRNGKEEKIISDNPVNELRNVLSTFRQEPLEGMPPFGSGLVGYFSYDSVRYFETIPEQNPDRLNVPDIHMILPRVLIAFDHIRQKLILITYGINSPEADQCARVLKHYEEKLYSAKPPVRISESGSTRINMMSNFKKESFLAAVQRAKDYIIAGDIFQVVLSQRFRAEVKAGPFEIYRKLRMINPSPYMFYMDFEDFQLIGSSPEVMVKRVKEGDKDEMIIRPIAGTRKRGRNREEDEAIEKELLADKKELAEHTMLLDLARNDVGRVAEFQSVRVEKPYHVERYSHVMHIVSDVIGTPAAGTDALSTIGVAFPAGTVSGSPKVRAMEIIEELEPEKRGVYAGAVGYIDFSGNTDTCIAIRTIVYKDKTAYIQAGAGIVYDSVPENEYQETINKAKALMKAIL